MPSRSRPSPSCSSTSTRSCARTTCDAPTAPSSTSTPSSAPCSPRARSPSSRSSLEIGLQPRLPPPHRVPRRGQFSHVEHRRPRQARATLDSPTPRRRAAAQHLARPLRNLLLRRRPQARHVPPPRLAAPQEEEHRVQEILDPRRLADLRVDRLERLLPPDRLEEVPPRLAVNPSRPHDERPMARARR